MKIRARRPAAAGGARVRTRAAIMAAVEELLIEGSFHEATVEEVAARAGVARATLYQHFGSRNGLVDSICDTLEAKPSLQAIRQAARLDDPVAALREAMRAITRFWAENEPLHRYSYGIIGVDPAAKAFVDRQTADRREVLRSILDRLPKVGRADLELAVAALLVLTSFPTFEELTVNGGLSEAATASLLVTMAFERVGLSEAQSDR